MIEPIFEGARSRCRTHTETLLMPNEKECEKCRTITRNFSLRPPFKVRANRDVFSDVKENMVYDVVWVIRDGAKEHYDHTSGYVLRPEGGNTIERIFDADDFTPLEFLTPEQTENLRKPVEKKQWTPCPEAEYWGG